MFYFSYSKIIFCTLKLKTFDFRNHVFIDLKKIRNFLFKVGNCIFFILVSKVGLNNNNNNNNNNFRELNENLKI